jgi:hypothetical protein
LCCAIGKDFGEWQTKQFKAAIALIKEPEFEANIMASFWEKNLRRGRSTRRSQNVREWSQRRSSCSSKGSPNEGTTGHQPPPTKRIVEPLSYINNARITIAQSLLIGNKIVQEHSRYAKELCMAAARA